MSDGYLRMGGPCPKCGLQGVFNCCEVAKKSRKEFTERVKREMAAMRSEAAPQPTDLASRVRALCEQLAGKLGAEYLPGEEYPHGDGCGCGPVLAFAQEIRREQDADCEKRGHLTAKQLSDMQAQARAEGRSEGLPRSGVEIPRCLVTNNRMGTDTRPAGQPCTCLPCAAYEQGRSEALEEAAKIAEGMKVRPPLDRPGLKAHNFACGDCAMAIRAAIPREGGQGEEQR